MIKIETVWDKDGIIISCKVKGHAGAGKIGTDIVCSAVSVLVRTVAAVLSNREDIVIRWEAPEPGFFFFEADYTAGGREFLFAAGEFLRVGFASIAGEYPKHCKLIQTRRT